MDIKKIGGGVTPYVQSKVEKGESPETAGKAGKASARTVAGDRVSVSSDAKLVGEAARAAEESPDVRVDRVEALRAQVEAGTYSPDSRRIAEKLVQSDLDFLR